MKNYLLVLSLLSVLSGPGCAGAGKNVSYAAPPEKTPESVAQANQAQTKTETGEEKAVRLAEEFIRRNGYTDAPADRENLTKESIEWESDTGRMLAARKNTLEAKAYGVSEGGRRSDKGWTVVFRHTWSKVDGKQNLKTGRAVTMDENFNKMMLEHVEFFLDKIKKKL